MTNKNLLILFSVLFVIVCILYYTDSIQYSDKITSDAKINRDIVFNTDENAS